MNHDSFCRPFCGWKWNLDFRKTSRKSLLNCIEGQLTPNFYGFFPLLQWILLLVGRVYLLATFCMVRSQASDVQMGSIGSFQLIVTTFSVFTLNDGFIRSSSGGDVKGVPGTEKPLEISVKPYKNPNENSAKPEKPHKNGRKREPQECQGTEKTASKLLANRKPAQKIASNRKTANL